MTKKNVMEIVGTIVGELSPLSSDERQRVIQASLTLLGETAIKLPKDENEEDGGGAALPARARTWIKQNGLSSENLSEVFLVNSDGVEVIAQIPGKNNRERVRNAYVLLGIAQLLLSGEVKFDDKAARGLCEKSGIYDQTNHMKYMKGGNEFTGSKDKGWTLTAPGLKRGAMLIKELSAA